HDIHRANGIKNFLGICINGVAVFSFSIAHMVSWPRALPMAVAATIGGYVGARTARRVGRTFIRRAIVVIGFAITIVMLWRMR
ncbi:MAG TPA: sulfite exporter TauE/SafE family protein, partial [Pyrinomonadaceae bacterium]|nr:sulfite exporter TauE/SafE family protein [Pyrinomonadaceae bacterium]